VSSHLGQELVSPRLRRLYARVQEQEARDRTRPLASGVHATVKPADESKERRDG
jgi:hypothetical protein